MFLVVVENKNLHSIRNVYFFKEGKKEVLLEKVRIRENLPDYGLIAIFNVENFESLSFYEGGIEWKSF